MAAPDKIDKLSPSELKAYIARGIIQVVQNKPIPTKIEETEEYQKVAHLRGQRIGVTAASRKYKVSQPNLSRWKERGYIPVIAKEGKQKLLLDESYVAYCVAVYKKLRGKGKTIFNNNGTPFIPKSPRD